MCKNLLNSKPNFHSVSEGEIQTSEGQNDKLKSFLSPVFLKDTSTYNQDPFAAKIQVGSHRVNKASCLHIIPRIHFFYKG